MNRTVLWCTLLFVGLMVAVPAIQLAVEPKPAEAVTRYFTLGIDLQGGTSLVYEVGSGRDLKDIIRILKDRVDPTGTKNYRISPRVGGKRIEVVMAGVDPEEVRAVKRLISRNGVLAFRILADPKDVGNYEELARRRLDGVEATDKKYEWIPLKYNSTSTWYQAARFLGYPTDKRSRKALVSREEAMKKFANGGVIYVIHPVGAAIRLGAKTLVVSDRQDEPETAAEKPAPDQEQQEQAAQDQPQTDPAADSAAGPEGLGAGVADIEVLVLRDTPPVGGDDFSRTGKDMRNASPIISFTMKNTARPRLAALTRKNVKKRMAIVLDGKVTSAPTIKSELRGGGIIEGYDSPKERDEVLSVLQSGTLDVPLTLLSERTLGPELGKDNIARGLRASLYSLSVVLVFMAAYYLAAGLVADIAVLLNLLIVILIMHGMQGVWTLPGIAGLILTVGMSVDANVLIFERIREELSRGSSVRLAIRNGYSRALPAIFDGNLTTFLTGVILVWFGNPEVKGFAIVLCIGLATSMFTALLVTRAVFELLQGAGLLGKMRMAPRLVKAGNINFTRIAKVAFVVSIILVVASVVGSIKVGQEKYGLGFRGGTALELKFSEQMGIEDVRRRVAELDTGTVITFTMAEATDLQELRDKITGLGPQYASAIVTEVKLSEKDNTERNFRVQVFNIDGARAVADISAALKLAGEPRSKKAADLGMGYAKAVVQPMRYVGEVKQDLRYSIQVMSDQDDIVKQTLRQEFKDVLEVSELQVKVDTRILTKERVLQMQNAPLAGAEASTSKLILSEYLKYVGALESTVELVGQGTTAQQIGKDIDHYLQQQEPDKVAFLREVRLAPDAEKRPGGYSKFIVYVYDVIRTTDQKQAEALKDSWQKTLRTAISKPPALVSTKIAQSIGAESKLQALYAAGVSLGVIILYIWFRFARVSYGFAAVCALVHDVAIVLGMVILFSWLGRDVPFIGEMKIDLPMIGAFLTLIGYSLNDTIVVFDRIRENRGKFGELSESVVNKSINQTLSRTILTSATTLAVVVILYFFAGEQSAVHGFAFVLSFGVIWGTYSSVVIASPLLLWLRRKSKTPGASLR
ncbi:MAG: protein translocase subunit SecD [Anaerolineaceae bacterium]|nr:protein translocase subunit SecD [Anaerolineaceae bacterium]